MKVKLSDIKIGDRQRRIVKNVDKLAQSIAKYGLLEPIVLDRDNNLIAGYRRLKAHELLRIDEIEANYIDEIDEYERQEIELEENLMRENLTWWEEDLARAKLDELKKKLYGAKVFGGEWSTEDTADSLGESVSLVRTSLQMAKAIEEIPELKEEKTRSAAIKRLKEMKAKVVRKELARRMEGRSDLVRVVKGDALSVLGEMEAESVDMVVCDPPFGVGLDEMVKLMGVKKYEGGYEDQMEVAKNLFKRVIPLIWRVMKEGSHLYLFYPIGVLHSFVFSELEKTFDFVDPIPLIWYKHMGGFTVNSLKRYHPHYQPFFFAQKGKRDLNQGVQVGNVFDVEGVTKRNHPAEMPVELFEILIEKSTEIGETVLDPFCGSGASMVAAVRKKRRGVGIEKEEKFYDLILARLAEEMRVVSGKEEET